MELYEKLNNEFGLDYLSNSDIKLSKILRDYKLSDKLMEDVLMFYDLQLDKTKKFTLISIYQNPSKKFIKKYKDKLNWLSYVSYHILTEKFIEEYEDYIDWVNVCIYQKLSEEFIEKHEKKLDWHLISEYQKLSEDFIRRHEGVVDWDYISKYQKLSESFIEEFSNKVNWNYISIFQKLSEDFIEKHDRDVNWIYINNFQKLSENFIINHRFRIFPSIINETWLYLRASAKKKKIEALNIYECHDDYFIAYKAIREDRYSLLNFQYKYEKGGIYESNCDCSSEEDSFGLNVGTEKFAKDYGNIKNNNYIIVRCKVRYEDVGRIVHGGDKIRCFKIEILD